MLPISKQTVKNSLLSEVFVSFSPPASMIDVVLSQVILKEFNPTSVPVIIYGSKAARALLTDKIPKDIRTT